MDQGNMASGSTRDVVIGEPSGVVHALEAKVLVSQRNLPTSFGVVDTSSFIKGIAWGTSAESISIHSCFHASGTVESFDVSQNYHSV